MAVRAYYDAPVAEFLGEGLDSILGALTREHPHVLEHQQRDAWLRQVPILRDALAGVAGHVFLELQIPRMGKRADAVLVCGGLVLVVEFKIGAAAYLAADLDQVEDYALDLKNFHEASHAVRIVPVLVASKAEAVPLPLLEFAADGVARPVRTNAWGFRQVLATILGQDRGAAIDMPAWVLGGYRPTPTIIEAAQTLYRTHTVADIARSDAGARNLAQTSEAVLGIIEAARTERRKAICFVTGVPGSGKTLAGLNIATMRAEGDAARHAVFLSGNGPLVDVLREALARDMVARGGVKKGTAERQVRSFIQNIHTFRDQYVGTVEVPVDRVVIFDEAQRAWTREQAAGFMQRKRGHADFDMSEPEFLIGVMDRHADWCVVICLVGGGQEINTGEAGISEWMAALERRFGEWFVYVSPMIRGAAYAPGAATERFLASARVRAVEDLHLAVSMRSFRAEALSVFVDHVLGNEPAAALVAWAGIAAQYPIVLTRDLAVARRWLRGRARGTERTGLVASAGAARLRPLGVHMKAPLDAPNWFLNAADDVRSSCFLEEVASEFTVQGLELDWAYVCWDGNFYHDGAEWRMQSFTGTKWHSVHKADDRLYLRNAYRVILTRARQGMVIFVPEGSAADWTRPDAFYDGTYLFLRACGVAALTEQGVDAGVVDVAAGP